MKANKALKRLAKIEALMSDVTERYSSAPHIREVLQDAKAAVTRAKEAVSLQASSGTAKNPLVKHSKPPSKATPEPSKPKRKLSAAGRKAIIAATKERWARVRAAKAQQEKAVRKKAAGKKALAKASSARQQWKLPLSRRPLSVAKTRSAGGATLGNVESGCGYAFGAGVS
jgi:hypothetical protein